MSAWREKWESVESKFATCCAECVTDYRSDAKCKDALEAAIADVWNLKDWLRVDPTSGISDVDVYAFLDTPEAFNINGCADVETKQKHLLVHDSRRDDTNLVLKANHNHPSGRPVVYSAVRKYPAAGNVDEWEDATEMVLRAVEEWRAFLTKRNLLPSTPPAVTPGTFSRLRVSRTLTDGAGAADSLSVVVRRASRG